MEVFPIGGRERIVQRFLCDPFKRFGPPLLVTWRGVWYANVVVPCSRTYRTSTLSWSFRERWRLTTAWSDSSVIAVMVCSVDGSRGGRREYAGLRLCVEGEVVGRSDCGVIFWMRDTQESRVYAIEREIIYTQQARGRGLAEFVN